MAAPIQLFINTAASSLGSALVRSVTDMTPVSLPTLVVGDSRTYEFYFVDGNGNYATLSGNSSYTPAVGIGAFGYPTGGTFTLTFGSQTTSALAYNASMATIQSALQGLSSIGSGNCSVSGVTGEYFTVTFTGSLAGAAQANIVANGTNLTPTSGVTVSTVVTGTTGVNAVQLLTLVLNPITYNGSLTPITNGWSGTLSTNTLAIWQSIAAAGSIVDTLQITVTDPSGNNTTYVQQSASITTTILNNASFAGTNAPNLVTQTQLSAAVLGLNNFTYQTITASSASSANISPSSTTRHHRVDVSYTGTTGGETYNLSAITTNSPNAGDTIIARILPGAPVSPVTRTIKIYNASTSGTLLDTISITEGSNTPILVILTYTGSAWSLSYDSSLFAALAQNLNGIASPLTAKANLRTLFSTIASSQTNSTFTITASQDGTLFPCNAGSNSITATLPSASSAGAGALLALWKTDSSTNAVIASGVSGGSINQSNALLILISNGSAWSVLLSSQSLQAIPSNSLPVVTYTGITGLAGGGSNRLDGQPTSGIYTPGQILELVIDTTNLVVMNYQFTAKGAGSTATPWIVYPTDYNSISNPYAWQLLRVTRQGQPVAWNTTSSQFNALVVRGSAGNETLQILPGFTVS